MDHDQNFENLILDKRFSIHRPAHYCLDLSELYKTKRVVPVVIFLHANKCPRQLEFFGDEQTYLSFEYISCVFADLAYEHYRETKYNSPDKPAQYEL